MSFVYTVQIRYKGFGRPDVAVLTPQLLHPAGRPPPHMFAGDLLCLHFPHEWQDHMRIAETIVPWASEWLFFYELWLITGEWHGGGHDPEAPKDCASR